MNRSCVFVSSYIDNFIFVMDNICICMSIMLMLLMSIDSVNKGCRSQ